MFFTHLGQFAAEVQKRWVARMHLGRRRLDIAEFTQVLALLNRRRLRRRSTPRKSLKARATPCFFAIQGDDRVVKSV